MVKTLFRSRIIENTTLSADITPPSQVAVIWNLRIQPAIDFSYFFFGADFYFSLSNHFFFFCHQGSRTRSLVINHCKWSKAIPNSINKSLINQSTNSLFSLWLCVFVAICVNSWIFFTSVFSVASVAFPLSFLFFVFARSYRVYLDWYLDIFGLSRSRCRDFSSCLARKARSCTGSAEPDKSNTLFCRLRPSGIYNPL